MLYRMAAKQRQREMTRFGQPTNVIALLLAMLSHQDSSHVMNIQIVLGSGGSGNPKPQMCGSKGF